MHNIARSLILPYTATEMYLLVDDVDSYRDFLPWCDHSLVLARDMEKVTAQIRIGVKGLNATFTTCNYLIVGQEIKIELVEGPFEQLSGVWRFLSLDASASRVSLDVEFCLSGKVANQTMGPVFKRICNTLVESFSDRAKEIYGEREFA